MALARKIREQREAEAKCAAAEADLEEQRLATAERDFILQRTASFADRRTEDARCLAVALEASRARVQRSSAWASSARQQARTLHASSAEHLDALPASGGVASAEGLTAAMDAAHKTCQEPKRVLREAFYSQQRVLNGLVNEVRSSGNQLSEVLASACVKSSEAAASEHAENSERLAAIDTATSLAASASSEGAAAAKAAAEGGAAAVSEQADSLSAAATSNGRALADASLRIAGDLEAARVAATSAQQAADDRLSNTLGNGLGRLSEGLHRLGSDSHRHGDSLVNARSRAADDNFDIAARRASISEAIQSVGAAHGTAVSSTSPLLSKALRGLADKLDLRHGQVHDSLTSTGSQLSVVRKHITQMSSSGEAAVQGALSGAGDHLAGAWTETQQCVNILISAVSDLDVAREDMAREVSELRQQRQAEERLVSLLALQRDGLQSDIGRTQASLLEVRSELEAARSALENTEEDQARRREETLQTVMSGMESLLRGGMEGIGRDLKNHNDTVRSHLVQAAERSSTAGTLVTGAEERALSKGEEAFQVAKSWAASSDSACDRIATAQAASLQASRQVHIAATENGGSVVAVAGRLQASQAAVQAKWAASRDALSTAASSWSKQDRVAVCALEGVATENDGALQKAISLQQEVFAQCSEAEAQVAARALEDQHHTALLAGLGQLHAECSQEDSGTEARHLGVLSALGEGALAIAEAAARWAPEADAAREAARGQAVAGAAAAKAQVAALEATGSAVAGLAPQTEAA